MGDPSSYTAVLPLCRPVRLRCVTQPADRDVLVSTGSVHLVALPHGVLPATWFFPSQLVL